MSNDRDCPNCIHRKENGCEEWDCKFEPIYIERSVIEDIKAEIKEHIHDQLDLNEDPNYSVILHIIDKHIGGK